MWWAMMIAMMLPSAGPTILLSAALNRRSQAEIPPYGGTAAFTTGYLLAWAGFSAVATALQWWLEHAGKLSMHMESIDVTLNGALLLIAGIWQNGLPVISPRNWFYLIWLAGINTAFAFTLWNHTLRTLKAMESSIINGTMLIQIAILAWIFLGEKITLQEGLGMLIAAAGAVLVQVRMKGSR